MSPIEKLKAEAVALREAEKARGHEIKHCDALELVAKKHGYANWRACLAKLGGNATTETPADAAAAPTPPSRSTIVASQLANGEFELARQSAFTRWLAPGLQQAAVDFSRNIGLLPIYSETSALGTRYLFWQLPVGARCEVRSGRTKEQFLAFEAVNRDQGRRLVSLHVTSAGIHSAVWISSEHHSVAVQFLARLGISPAEVKDTPAQP